MKAMFAIICWGIISTSALRAQDWQDIDFRTRGIRAEDPRTLAQMLTAHCQRDKEKARSIFRWIADNIEYHRAPPRPSRVRDKLRGFQLPNDTGALPALTERVALKVLKDKQTHCEGFARLFQSLCDHAKIPAVIITGYARTGRGDRFNSNHAWNAVYFDSSWHLLDVTWAAGHYSIGSSLLMQQYADQYFMANPASFYEQHFPDDLRWTLLSNTSAPDELKKSPFRPRSFSKYSIEQYKPQKGIIEAAVGDTLHFVFRTQAIVRGLAIAPDSLWDSTFRWISPQVAYIQPDLMTGDEVYYQYVLQTEELEWLHLLFNQDVVLRYRLKLKPVKQPKTDVLARKDWERVQEIPLISPPLHP